MRSEEFGVSCAENIEKHVDAAANSGFRGASGGVESHIEKFLEVVRGEPEK